MSPIHALNTTGDPDALTAQGSKTVVISWDGEPFPLVVFRPRYAAIQVYGRTQQYTPLERIYREMGFSNVTNYQRFRFRPVHRPGKTRKLHDKRWKVSLDKDGRYHLHYQGADQGPSIDAQPQQWLDAVRAHGRVGLFYQRDSGAEVRGAEFVNEFLAGRTWGTAAQLIR